MQTALEQLITVVGNAAQRLGVQHIVIVAQDPVTKQIALIASKDPAGKSDTSMAVLRAKVGEKFKFTDGGSTDDVEEASWS